MYLVILFFFNDTATTEIYTLSLHDALPISGGRQYVVIAAGGHDRLPGPIGDYLLAFTLPGPGAPRSEEHTSELQSRLHLVCRLLLEKKKDYDVACYALVLRGATGTHARAGG